MIDQLSPLEWVIAHGNRGHAPNWNWIRCGDGLLVSVTAGGGAKCWPQPASCTCAVWSAMGQPERAYVMPSPNAGGYVPHDYPGPYSHVEVLVEDPDQLPPAWRERSEALAMEGDVGGLVGFVPVDSVRAFVAQHGGAVDLLPGHPDDAVAVFGPVERFGVLAQGDGEGTATGGGNG